MSIKIKKDGEKTVCCFQNPRCDFEYMLENEPKVLKGIEGASSVVFDMKNVEFIASAFIRLCIQVLKIQGKENFEIVNASKLVAAILSVSKLDVFIKISGA